MPLRPEPYHGTVASLLTTNQNRTDDLLFAKTLKD
ncbi:MAG: hypothetical protein JWQ42_2089 [Edaphobacter sp.]|nr:hypothetical protein [Edaphobacter sp.]